MKLKVKNIKVNEVIGLLEEIPLKGLKSIHRTRLVQQLTEKLERVVEEQDSIRKEHCHLDEDGNPKTKESGELDIKDFEEFNKVILDFYNEEVVIDGGDSQVALRSVKSSLEETEMEFEGAKAHTYAYLYDSFTGDDQETGDDE